MIGAAVRVKESRGYRRAIVYATDFGACFELGENVCSQGRRLRTSVYALMRQDGELLPAQSAVFRNCLIKWRLQIMLQRLGIETDRFASSTGTMRGLEMV